MNDRDLVEKRLKNEHKKQIGTAESLKCGGYETIRVFYLNDTFSGSYVPYKTFDGQDAAKRTHTENGISEEPRKMKEADRGDFRKRSITENLRRNRRRFSALFVRTDDSSILFYYIYLSLVVAGHAKDLL